MNLRPPRGVLWDNNFAATISATAPGTTITASGSTNTKGSWTQLFSSTAGEVVGMNISITNNTTASSAVTMLLDIGIGGAGSEVVKVENLLMSLSSLAGAPMGTLYIPIRIPKGTRIAARCQSNTASKTTSLLISLEYAGDYPSNWAADGATTIGADTTTSTGLLHATGSSGTFSAWTNIGSTTGRILQAIRPMVGVGSDSVMSNHIGYIEIGVSSTAYARWMFQATTSEQTGPVYPDRFLYRQIPSGTQLQIRATVHTTADADLGFAILGLY